MIFVQNFWPLQLLMVISTNQTRWKIGLMRAKVVISGHQKRCHFKVRSTNGNVFKNYSYQSIHLFVCPSVILSLSLSDWLSLSLSDWLSDSLSVFWSLLIYVSFVKLFAAEQHVQGWTACSRLNSMFSLIFHCSYFNLCRHEVCSFDCKSPKYTNGGDRW